jgi:hypothetical protein
MRKTLFLVVPFCLAGCQTWGPTWSELTGARYNRAIEYRLPTIITRVDDQGAFASQPIKVEPGMHMVRVQGTLPGWAGYTYREMNLDIQPCKRYYLNAQYENLINPNFTAVIDDVEEIAGCKVTVASK